MTIYQLKIYEGTYDKSPKELFYFTLEGAQRGAEEWLTERGYINFQQPWAFGAFGFDGNSWCNESFPDDFIMRIFPKELLH